MLGPLIDENSPAIMVAPRAINHQIARRKAFLAEHQTADQLPCGTPNGRPALSRYDRWAGYSPRDDESQVLRKHSPVPAIDLPSCSPALLSRRTHKNQDRLFGILP